MLREKWEVKVGRGAEKGLSEVKKWLKGDRETDDSTVPVPTKLVLHSKLLSIWIFE
jgi:hypothetical protein